jgi:hypothetical protein
MNVLILTPDRVGSTLLQRLITVYMTAHIYDKPVINLHELTNGLMKYYSPTFNQEVLGKPNDNKPWGYYQSLSEITDLLNSTDHYKTSRLAQYHIRRRQDSLAEQIPFYEYLNDNFFIISAQRENLLEHALSWGIQNQSKKLNVYSREEKIETFADIYRNKITIDQTAFVRYLDNYVEYTEWVKTHFNVSSYFKYERDLPNIEEYILGLNIFNNQEKKKSWNDIFEIEFNDWNRCHYLISDISGIGQQLPNNQQKLQLTFDNNTEVTDNFQLQSVEKKDIPTSLSVADQEFLTANGSQYVRAYKAISELVENKVLVKSVPIKLQTMLEKQLVIKNFKECVDTYNQWSENNGVGKTYDFNEINSSIKDEITRWHSVPKLT